MGPCGKLRQVRSVAACLAVLVVGLLANGCDLYGFGEWSTHTGYNFGETTITCECENAHCPLLGFRRNHRNGDPPGRRSRRLLRLRCERPRGLSRSTVPPGARVSPPCGHRCGATRPARRSGTSLLEAASFTSRPRANSEAFDAAGQTNCYGTPEVCQPLWSASGTYGTPTVSDPTVYVTTSARLEAFDAAGHGGCSGEPSDVLSPLDRFETQAGS